MKQTLWKRIKGLAAMALAAILIVETPEIVAFADTVILDDSGADNIKNTSGSVYTYGTGVVLEGGTYNGVDYQSAQVGDIVTDSDVLVHLGDESRTLFLRIANADGEIQTEASLSTKHGITLQEVWQSEKQGYLAEIMGTDRFVIDYQIGNGGYQKFMTFTPQKYVALQASGGKEIISLSQDGSTGWFASIDLTSAQTVYFKSEEELKTGEKIAWTLSGDQGVNYTATYLSGATTGNPFISSTNVGGLLSNSSKRMEIAYSKQGQILVNGTSPVASGVYFPGATEFTKMDNRSWKAGDGTQILGSSTNSGNFSGWLVLNPDGTPQLASLTDTNWYTPDGGGVLYAYPAYRVNISDENANPEFTIVADTYTSEQDYTGNQGSYADVFKEGDKIYAIGKDGKAICQWKITDMSGSLIDTVDAGYDENVGAFYYQVDASHYDTTGEQIYIQPVYGYTLEVSGPGTTLVSYGESSVSGSTLFFPAGENASVTVKASTPIPGYVWIPSYMETTEYKIDASALSTAGPSSATTFTYTLGDHPVKLEYMPCVSIYNLAAFNPAVEGGRELIVYSTNSATLNFAGIEYNYPTAREYMKIITPQVSQEGNTWKASLVSGSTVTFTEGSNYNATITGTGVTFQGGALAVAAASGANMTLVASPIDTYITITTADGNPVEKTETVTGTYTFTMPAQDVQITAEAGHRIFPDEYTVLADGQEAVVKTGQNIKFKYSDTTYPLIDWKFVHYGTVTELPLTPLYNENTGIYSLNMPDCSLEITAIRGAKITGREGILVDGMNPANTNVNKAFGSNVIISLSGVTEPVSKWFINGQETTAIVANGYGGYNYRVNQDDFDSTNQRIHISYMISGEYMLTFNSAPVDYMPGGSVQISAEPIPAGKELWGFILSDRYFDNDYDVNNAAESLGITLVSSNETEAIYQITAPEGDEQPLKDVMIIPIYGYKYDVGNATKLADIPMGDHVIFTNSAQAAIYVRFDDSYASNSDITVNNGTDVYATVPNSGDGKSRSWKDFELTGTNMRIFKFARTVTITDGYIVSVNNVPCVEGTTTADVFATQSVVMMANATSEVFDSWQITPDRGNLDAQYIEDDGIQRTFKMIDSDVAVAVNNKPVYTLTAGEYLTVETASSDGNAQAYHYVAGKEVSLLLNVPDTYTLNGFLVTDGTGNPLALRPTGPNEVGRYTLTMPASDVNVSLDVSRLYNLTLENCTHYTQGDADKYVEGTPIQLAIPAINENQGLKWTIYKMVGETWTEDTALEALAGVDSDDNGSYYGFEAPAYDVKVSLEIFEYIRMTADSRIHLYKGDGSEITANTNLLPGDEIKAVADGTEPAVLWFVYTENEAAEPTVDLGILDAQRTANFTLPNANVRAEYLKLFTITSVGAFIESDVEQLGDSYVEGSTLQITAQNEQYGAEFYSWQILDALGEDVSIEGMEINESVISLTLEATQPQEMSFTAIVSYLLESEGCQATFNDEPAERVAVGSVVELKADEKPGYSFGYWKVLDIDGENEYSESSLVLENSAEITFEMPANSIRIEPVYLPNVVLPEQYFAVSADGGELSSYAAEPGALVKLIHKSDEDVLTTIRVTDAKGEDVEVLSNSTGWSFVMPQTTVTVTQTSLAYAINLTDCGTESGGSKLYYLPGTRVTLNAVSKDGMAWDGWTVNGVEDLLEQETTESEEGTLSFVMPAAAISVTATFSKLYTASVDIQGETTVKSLKAGETMELVATDSEEQRFQNWVITDEKGEDITDTLLKDATRKETSFVMPEGSVKVEARFEEKHAPANAVMKVGVAVRLVVGTPYKFETGKTWKVSGDTTQYFGGMTFYVGENAEFTFE